MGFSLLQQWPRVDSHVYNIIDDSALVGLISGCERHQELKAVSAWNCEERLGWVHTHTHTHTHKHTHTVRETPDRSTLPHVMLLCAE